ncbi:MAG: nitrilase-related carbon-nitrogen hydrolase [Crocinitomicaceae bacterium]|mgnify:FL=1|jgi:predicted amidohydrolase|tara:strand:+ start:18920 stop:19696 length:777 start_codon:yes stop_codon:yes gene_type:complete
MQDLKVAILQFDQHWEDKQKNYSKIRALLKNKEGCDLLLIPEMFHTGFTMNHLEHAEEIATSLGIEFLKDLSVNLNCAIYTSLIIKEKNKTYNRGVLISKNEITYYNKRKCFSLGGENEHFTAGTKEVVQKLKGWNLNLQICYDLRFPELIRNELKDGLTPKYDALLYVANWPKKRIEHWKKLLQARAIENQCYVIACNRIGTDGNGIEYNGNSMTIHPDGSLFESRLKEGQEGLEIAKLSYINLNEFRKKLPFLQDR